jgi:hypothetical protein
MDGSAGRDFPMKGFGRWIHDGTRRAGLAAALVGFAMLLAPGGSVPEAVAGTGKADLTLGPGGSGTDAEGRIQIKQRRRGERLKIRLDNLEPRTDYELRDGSTEEVLGTIRTDRRGRGKKTLRSSAGESMAGLRLEVCEPGSDDPVLEGTVPGDDSGMPWFDGSYSIGTVSTDPDAAVQVSITLSSTTMKEGAHRDGTYESISLFVGPGGYWVMEDGNAGEPGEPVSIPGPVTFWIAGRDGDLVKVATIEESDGGVYVPLPGVVDNLGDRMPFFDGTYPDGGNDGGDHGGDGTIYPQPEFFSWYADNTTEDGLPLGVDRVGDLSGRAFEVRDGEGHVLLDGVLPELEEVVFDPWPEPLPDPVPCPWGDIDVDITINIDLSGFDWNSIDLSQFDWSTFDFSGFDWGSIDFGGGGDDGGCGFDFSDFLENFKY